MSNQQSTLGGEGVAEELAAEQRSISIAEFFEKNKHMLGFDSPGRAIVTAVKEAVDNALDATEEAEILPTLSVEIEKCGQYYKLIVEDNGPGIPESNVPKVFGKLLYGSRFHVRRQSRGQQGIGISAAVLYSQLTSGKPAKVISKTQVNEKAKQFSLTVDTDSNEPDIKSEGTVEWEGVDEHGTRIEIQMEANMRARKQLHNYIRYTAVVNPHATITLEEPSASLSYERVTQELPDETNEILPHPHGVELGTLQKMLDNTDSHSLSGFLQTEFTRVGQKSADSILNGFRDRHHGREVAWPVPTDEHEPTNMEDYDDRRDELRDAVDSAIRNKGPEATDGFISVFFDELEEEVTHSQLHRVVDTAAENATNEFGKTFGSTVREKVREAAWEVIATGGEEGIQPLLDEATTSRRSDALLESLAGKITSELHARDGRYRFTELEIQTVVDSAADSMESSDEHGDVRIGDTARENILEELWNAMYTVPDDVPLVREITGERDMEEALLRAMQSADLISPPTDCLSPIKDELLEAGLEKVYSNASFYAASTRGAESTGGEPFIAEAGLAYGVEGRTMDDKAELLRFANRVPLVYKEGGCGVSQTVKSIDWRNYFPSGSGLKQTGGNGLPNGSLVIAVHVASTNVPFTSESKDALASVPEIEHEIELAVREAARKLKSYLSKQQSLQKRQKKQNKLTEILPELATKSATVANTDCPDITDSMANIMNNVIVNRTVNGDRSAKVTVENYTKGAKEFDLVEQFESEPSNLPDNATVEENENGWEVRFSFSLDSGDSADFEYTAGDETSLRSARIEDELINITTEVTN